MTLPLPESAHVRRADHPRAHALYSAGISLARARLAFLAGRPGQGQHLLYQAGAQLGEVQPSGDPVIDAGLWRLRMTVFGPRLDLGLSRQVIDHHFEELLHLVEQQLADC